MLKYNFPVDVVYTWVDGSDPVWLAKKDAALTKLQDVNEPSAKLDKPQLQAQFEQSSVDDCRFIENDELRYSLRSLEKYAPWVRNVFLLTDEQKPEWLDTTQVKLVSHREVFPAQAAYPTFSSRPIELCMHRIPNLAEHFLSLNDDFMLGASTKLSDFFTAEGKPLIWVSKKSETHHKKLLDSIELAGQEPSSAVDYSRYLIYRHFGKALFYSPKHYPKSMTVSGMEELWRVFEPEVQRTLTRQFRCPDDALVRILYTLYMLCTGKGALRVTNGVQQFIDFFKGRLLHVGASLGDPNFKRKAWLVKAIKPLTFCLNDSHWASFEDRQALKDFLAALFPEKSKYEK